MPRRLTPERMDAPDVPREDLEEALRFIRLVNRRLGGIRPVLRLLSSWSPRWPATSPEHPIRILDIATGAADIPLAIADWASRAGHHVHITAVDLHLTTLDIARADLGDHPHITLLHHDALKLTDTFDVDHFDYVHAGLFLHHLHDIEVLTMLRIMHRLARRGLIWNDLVRSPLALAFIRLTTLGLPPIIRHDARVSVEAGFTRREVLDIRNRVGLPYCHYHWNLFTHRFTLAGEKKGAWT